MLLKKKNNNLWTIYLFYNGVQIKKIKMPIDGIKINEQVLFIKVHGHKDLFGNNNITLAVRPQKLLMTNEEKRQTYWGVVFEKGVDVE